MRINLIHNQSNKTIYSYDEETKKCTFVNDTYKRTMIQTGIPAHQLDSNGRKQRAVVHLDPDAETDELFHQAFRSYAEQEMRANFHWQVV